MSHEGALTIVRHLLNVHSLPCIIAIVLLNIRDNDSHCFCTFAFNSVYVLFALWIMIIVLSHNFTQFIMYTANTIL